MNLLQRYRSIPRKKWFYVQVALGVLYLFVSLYLDYIANVYSAATASGAVHDLILDRLGPYDVSFIFLQGVLIFVIFLLLFLLARPTRLPFMLKTVALFYSIRSFFIILTHLSPPIGEIYIPTTGLLHFFSLGNDLFFSGHTGLPFLFALVFWENPRLRILFLALTFFFGFAALLGHLHYSIDVFAAFFITYGIFKMAAWAFGSDYALLMAGEKL